VVERLKLEYDVDVEWRPFYLFWDTPPEGKELSEHIQRARKAGSEERLQQMAEAYGMKFTSTRRIYNTRLAHEATEFARAHGGMANEFHRAVFSLVYAEGQDPSQWGALRSVAEQLGLDAEEMQREVQEGKYTAEVEEQVQWAYRIGVSGVPTYVINDRYAIVGAQPYEAFKDALDSIMNSEAAQKRAEGK
jgi:predicted DsbA family dithiol-disulfide isomerase